MVKQRKLIGHQSFVTETDTYLSKFVKLVTAIFRSKTIEVIYIFCRLNLPEHTVVSQCELPGHLMGVQLEKTDLAFSQ